MESKLFSDRKVTAGPLAETEDTLKCLNYGKGVIVFGRGLQDCYGGMQDSIDNAVGQRLDGILLRGIQLTEASAHAFDLALANSLEVLFQRGNHCLYLRLAVQGERGFRRQRLLVHRTMISGMHAAGSRKQNARAGSETNRTHLQPWRRKVSL